MKKPMRIQFLHVYRWLGWALIALFVCFFCGPAGATPFVWDRDTFWGQIEQRFIEARLQPCERLASSIFSELEKLEGAIRQSESVPLAPEEPLWDKIEDRMLSLAPLIAACPESLPRYRAAVQRVRRGIKNQAQKWSWDTENTRRRLYRMIYGGRIAVEEILLQIDPQHYPNVTVEENTPSELPSVTVRGIALRSGDILVSRGGAPTSALIARGSDFPGNFSHVALLHVDADTGLAVVLESLIERGAVITPLEEYLQDKKLRIMALRLRADLPPVRQNPLLPHSAADHMHQLLARRNIPYDFEMDYRNHNKIFCSELIFAAYEKIGIHLWTGLSHISAEGTARWLAAFGVSHFVTLEPSDLEYDPQLQVVAEWCEPGTLFKDHVDNAVTDAMLEGANAGDDMKYNPLLLPVSSIVKGYSMIKNSWGGVGPIPEGMGPAAALRNKWYSKLHDRLTEGVYLLAEAFKKEKGYAPPYWELVRMARELHHAPNR